MNFVTFRIKAVKSRRIQLTGYEVWIVGTKNDYRIWARKLIGKQKVTKTFFNHRTGISNTIFIVLNTQFY